MNKKKAIISIIIFAILLVTSFISMYFIFFYSDLSTKEPSLGKVDSNYLEDKNLNTKEELPLSSNYVLEPMKFMAKTENGNKTFISITVAVSYPYMDSEAEKEIILRRYYINRLIKDYLSQKSYTELNSADKRKRLRRKLYFKIKKIMKNPILDIYFRSYMHNVIVGQEE